MEREVKSLREAIKKNRIQKLKDLWNSSIEIQKSFVPREAQFSSVGIIGYGREVKKPIKVFQVDWRTLKDISQVDPVIFSIKRTLKSFINQLKWDIVPDIDDLKNELRRWESIVIANLNPWGLSNHFTTERIDEEILKRTEVRIQEVLRKNVSRYEKIQQVRWVFDTVEKMIEQEALKYCYKVKKLFESPNEDAERNFYQFQEKILEDILVFDAGVIYKVLNDDGYLYPDGALYVLPGNEVVRWITEDRRIPDPPNVAYSWEPFGEGIKGMFTRDEIVYISQNLQHDFYGISPIEAVIYVIVASLYADKWAIDMLKETNIPPALINLGANVSPEERVAFQTQFEQSVMGKAVHKVAFMSGTDEVQVIPLKNMTARDMEIDAYRKWATEIKCMAFGISPQDVGVVADFHRTTAEVQQRLTASRGVANLVSLLERAYTEEIIKKSFPPEFKVCKFKFIFDLFEGKRSIGEFVPAIKSGIMSRNEVREQIGLPSVAGGDDIVIETPAGFISVEEIAKQKETGQLEGLLELLKETKKKKGQIEELKGEKEKVKKIREYFKDKGVEISETVNDEQLRIIKETLERVPERLLEEAFKLLKKITCDARMGLSKSKYPNHGKWERDEGVLRLNPDVFKDDDKIQHTILHEIGHIVDDIYNISERGDWLILSGWVRKREEGEEELKKGGEGSGHFDHSGRVGEVGGSLPRGMEEWKLEMPRWTKKRVAKTQAEKARLEEAGRVITEKLYKMERNDGYFTDFDMIDRENKIVAEVKYISKYVKDPKIKIGKNTVLGIDSYEIKEKALKEKYVGYKALIIAVQVDPDTKEVRTWEYEGLKRSLRINQMKEGKREKADIIWKVLMEKGDKNG